MLSSNRSNSKSSNKSNKVEPQELSGFYILEINGEVCVYKQDRVTLYFKTGLLTKDLPPDVRREVQKGKFMDTELQVYHFIESYSS